jgi:hypothetical protein
MPFRARIAPRFGYGSEDHAITETESGVAFTASSLTVSLTATVPHEHDGRDVTAEFTLAEGQFRDAAFCVYALLRLGFSSEADAFMRFILEHTTARRT